MKMNEEMVVKIKGSLILFAYPASWLREVRTALKRRPARTVDPSVVASDRTYVKVISLIRR